MAKFRVAPVKIPYRIIVTNAFSLNMLSDDDLTMAFTQVDLEEARQFLYNWAEHAPVISIVGHTDMATVLTEELGYEIPCNRVTYKKEFYDLLLIAQYSGPRLPEGAASLPENAEIRYWISSQVD